MKRLFEMNGVFYGSKEAAKIERGEAINPAHEEDKISNGVKIGTKQVPATYKHKIGIGPDHWRMK